MPRETRMAAPVSFIRWFGPVLLQIEPRPLSVPFDGLAASCSTLGLFSANGG